MGRHTWMEIGAAGRSARDGARRRIGGRVAALVLGLVALAGLGSVGAVAMAVPRAAMPCEDNVKACARLSTNEAWLSDGKGNILRGPVRMNHGAPGNETPVGFFSVQRKEEVHLSKEYNNARMPWSVFFDDNGRAFHGGDPARQSAGCVRMADPDAQAFFNGLNVYDRVQIVE
ncbi:L,D-transpeptidase [Actinomycetospora flava]|uniref:L,D-transpeptidase n=1 Tax=Actinomycetospora flava TaxID=3129232 RepID=A0ABU8MB70_9PSEU